MGYWESSLGWPYTREVPSLPAVLLLWPLLLDKEVGLYQVLFRGYSCSLMVSSPSELTSDGNWELYAVLGFEAGQMGQWDSRQVPYPLYYLSSSCEAL